MMDCAAFMTLKICASPATIDTFTNIKVIAGGHSLSWMPCEVPAFCGRLWRKTAFDVAIKHFSTTTQKVYQFSFSAFIIIG